MGQRTDDAAVRVELVEDLVRTESDRRSPDVGPSEVEGSMVAVATAVVALVALVVGMWAIARPDAGRTAADTPIVVPTTTRPDDHRVAGPDEERTANSSNGAPPDLLVRVEDTWLGFGPRLVRSIDGVTWTPIENDIDDSPVLALSYEDQVFGALSRTGPNEVTLWQSIDARDWSAVETYDFGTRTPLRGALADGTAAVALSGATEPLCDAQRPAVARLLADGSAPLHRLAFFEGVRSLRASASGVYVSTSTVALSSQRGTQVCGAAIPDQPFWRVFHLAADDGAFEDLSALNSGEPLTLVPAADGATYLAGTETVWWSGREFVDPVIVGRRSSGTTAFGAVPFSPWLYQLDDSGEKPLSVRRVRDPFAPWHALDVDPSSTTVVAGTEDSLIVMGERDGEVWLTRVPVG